MRMMVSVTGQFFTHSFIKRYLFNRHGLKAGRGLGTGLGTEQSGHSLFFMVLLLIWGMKQIIHKRLMH